MPFVPAYGRRLSVVIVPEVGTGIPADNDIILEDEILNDGVLPDPNLTVIVEIASGVCIGSTSTAWGAIRTGDLTGWKRVELHIPSNSKATGKGGAGGARQYTSSAEGNDGSDGGPALQVTDGSTLYMTQASQDLLYGGGGGGGGGAAGDDYTWTSWTGWYDSFNPDYPDNRYRWEQWLNSAAVQIRYNNTVVYNKSDHGWVEEGYHTEAWGTDGKLYQRAAYVRWEDRFWDYRIGTVNSASGGDGGFGGRGAGPCISGETGGGAGVISGDHDGGNGGDGGELRAAGQPGKNSQDGNLGGDPGQPGVDIDIISGSIITI